MADNTNSMNKIRSFGSVIDADADGNIFISPSGTPLDATCDWFGCNEIWAVKLWRLPSLNKAGLANTPALENVLLCEKHELEGCKPACHWNELN